MALLATLRQLPHLASCSYATKCNATTTTIIISHLIFLKNLRDHRYLGYQKIKIIAANNNNSPVTVPSIFFSFCIWALQVFDIRQLVAVGALEVQ